MSQILEAAKLSPHQLQQILSDSLATGADFADLYFQKSQRESWFLEDGIVKEGSFDSELGFGFRVQQEETTGFAYANDLSVQALTQAGVAARQISEGQQSYAQALSTCGTVPLYSDDNPLQSWSESQKVDFLKAIDAYARKQSSFVKQVIVNLSAAHTHVAILNTLGTMQVDIRPVVQLTVRVVVEKNGRVEQGSGGGGARANYYWLEQQSFAFVDKAVRQALLNLRAVDAPAGIFPVVLGAGWPAVLFHEAVGHGLEGDFNRKGSSVFAGRIGEQVASDVCTLIDDGSIPDRLGSVSIDDEGVAGQKTVLLEKGVLKGYLFDRLNARLMGVESTGNGRRQSYRYPPLPRMTNTYLAAGNDKPTEIIASVDEGVYAVDFSGGQVDITSGSFVFSANEAYLIKKGQIAEPIKGVTLVGNGPEVLPLISMVGDDLALDSGLGNCGKDGQTVAVGVGQPTLKVDALTVGGSAA